MIFGRIGGVKISIWTTGPSAEEAGAILTIDLGAVRENYRRLKSRLGGMSCAAVVKANAYGLGAAPVAKALMQEGCDTFFVVFASEGVDLRKAIGPRPAVYILNGLSPGSEELAAEHDLRPVLNSADQLAAWRALAAKAGPIPSAALQVDSGMSRLGMSPVEVDAVVADAGAFEGVEVSLVMSHLACADEPENPANALQLAAFEALSAQLPAAQRSLANSSGLFLGASYHLDLGRPGVALYGVNPTPGHENPMRPVVSLHAKVVQTRDVEIGIGVGYGHTLLTERPTRLATIALGYADGWHRRATGAGWFDGVRLPFAGRVSMDSIILDVSDLPPGALKAGDLIEMIGPHQSVDDVAAYAGTIGYEILTSLGDRFHRRYIDEQV